MSPAGVKWKGRSMHQVRTALQEADRIGRAARVTAQALAAQEKQHQALAAHALVKALQRTYLEPLPEFADLKGEDIVFGWWECKDSPTGHCIYNGTEDPMHDDCLFCHDPRERK